MNLFCNCVYAEAKTLCFSYFHNYSYECPEFHKFDPNKCYFRGKFFNIREDHIKDETEATDPCELPCTCYTWGENGPAEFECPADDGCEDEGLSKCITQYSTLNTCCSDLEVCGK